MQVSIHHLYMELQRERKIVENGRVVLKRLSRTTKRRCLNSRYKQSVSVLMYGASLTVAVHWICSRLNSCLRLGPITAPVFNSKVIHSCSLKSHSIRNPVYYFNLQSVLKKMPTEAVKLQYIHLWHELSYVNDNNQCQGETDLAS